MPLPPRLSEDEISALLDRVDKETTAAGEDLEYAQHIVEKSGLTVHSSVLNNSRFAPDSLGSRAVPSSNGQSGNQPMYKQEAAAAAHARQTFNPLRGTLVRDRCLKLRSTLIHTTHFGYVLLSPPIRSCSQLLLDIPTPIT
jgi:hypothetical protein